MDGFVTSYEGLGCGHLYSNCLNCSLSYAGTISCCSCVRGDKGTVVCDYHMLVFMCCFLLCLRTYMLFPSCLCCSYQIVFFSSFVRILLPSCCVVHFFCPAPACVVCCLHVVSSCFSRCRQCCQCQLLPRGGWCGGGDRTPAVCLHSSTRPETYHPPCALRRQAYSVVIIWSRLVTACC